MLPFQSCRISSSVCRMEKSVKEIDYCMSVAGRGCQDGTRLFFLLINFFLSIVRSFFFPKMGKIQRYFSFLSCITNYSISIELLHVRSIAVILLTDQLLRSNQFVNLKVQNLQSNRVKLAYRVPSKLWLRIIENGKPSLHNIGHKLSGIHLVYTKRSLSCSKNCSEGFCN